MAGHSKWANIKHKKERADAKKGKIFSRVAKEIISAVKQGGPDPKANTKLRLALQKAKAANVPSDVIDRNIKKAASADQADFTEVTYELYGHGGVGIIVDAMTDNKNRTASDMRIATNKKGGTIASPGSVAFNFERKGVIQIGKDQGEEEELFMQATEAGADDFEGADETFIVITPPERLYEVKEKLEAAGIAAQNATLEMIPKTTVDCDQDTREANQALIDFLEGLDDVDSVFHNMSE
ncbi:YebC/PmpR family DNA-binding transcriptional regulator [Candidatus Neptunochlamydia vexilliferae]|uniref:Probable transcriptional regulatory protein NEPTK9_001266 n=1 Tax=Candidatus Neptunichlamydia vexilliferae TaxID=1651774 RepID=A0ABS0B040_9BACT|nr:YebC/PmpR family DNA-binding transcriptional regulator [Candidatus Neptunochlamydia vexilliferae]MBF5059749.1 putative transcriptional regulatory protein [Candidatus Neptunochlamydia vexilliferae]